MVDETTFALIIESVSLSDAGSYQCVLGVKDPAGMRLIYPQTETIDLTLVVYRKSEELFTEGSPPDSLGPFLKFGISHTLALFFLLEAASYIAIILS